MRPARDGDGYPPSGQYRRRTYQKRVPGGGDLGGLPGNQRLLQSAAGAGADGHSAESAGRPVFWADGGIISAAADGRLPRADAGYPFYGHVGGF